jgi:hypothetical protein
MRSGRVVSPGIVALVLATSACVSATAGQPQAAGTGHAAPRVSSAGFAPATDVLAPAPKPTFSLRAVRPRTRPLPDGTTRLFPGHRLVAFYGLPDAPGLGVLGSASADALWPRLARQARAYGTAHTPVLPAYEVIAFEATNGRGNTGQYSSRLADHVIARYVNAARKHHGYVVLDIQPGRGSFLTMARSLRRWLRLPGVGLGIDPEWKLHGSQLPSQQIGHTDAHEINETSRWLARLTARSHLPQKLLLVHQFTESMVQDKAGVHRRHGLAIVFNVDGFGSAAAKIGKYDELARHQPFRSGFKLFYDMDIGLLSPARVLRLRPRPAVVEYE